MSQCFSHIYPICNIKQKIGIYFKGHSFFPGVFGTSLTLGRYHVPIIWEVGMCSKLDIYESQA